MNTFSIISSLAESGNSAFAAFPQNPLVEAIGWALIHSLWIVVLMALMLYLLLRLTRKKSPQLRYAISCVTLFSMPFVLIVAVGMGWGSESNSTRLSSNSVNVERNIAVAAVEMQTPDAKAELSPDQPLIHKLTETTGADATSETFLASVVRTVNVKLPWIVGAWLLGALFFSIRPIVGWIAVERLRRSGIENASDSARTILQKTAEKLNLNRTVQLVESAFVKTPIVVGWLRPMILLPLSAATGLSEKELAALLAHELAHVRRHDYLVNFLQTIVETMMYYHPCVWWMSRVIREERENCCDDLAIQVCNESDYSQALLTMENLRDHEPALAMSAAGGSLVKRIRRIAGLPESHRPHGWAGAIAPLIAFAAGVLFVFFAVSNLNASGDADDVWSEVSAGLHLRVVPVSAGMSEDEIQMDQSNGVFESFEDLAFAVEIENVTDKPIKFLDTRYGEGFGENAGAANSDWLSQFLFSLKYFDADGKQIAQPAVEFLDLSLPLQGAMLTELAPQQKHQFLVRPAKMLSMLQPRLKKGKYSATVCYRGFSQQAAKRLSEYMPNSPVLAAWNGSAESRKAGFVLEHSKDRAKPIWGKAVDGIQTALEIENSQEVYRSGDRPEISLLVRNTDSSPVVFSGFTYLKDDLVDVVDATGKSVLTSSTWYSGWTLSARVTLEPGQICRIQAGNLGIAKDKDAAEEFNHVTHRKLIADPGQYKLRIRHRFAPAGLKDGSGELISPNDKDWRGTVDSGWLPLTISE